jgi:hypothetical protein
MRRKGKARGRCGVCAKGTGCSPQRTQRAQRKTKERGIHRTKGVRWGQRSSSEFVQNDKVAANAGAASICIGGPPQKAIPYKGKKREEGGASWC